MNTRSIEINWKVLREIDELSPGETPASFEIFAMFRTNSLVRLTDIRKFAADRDAEKLARAAHAYKSAASCIGAITLTETCDEISRALKIVDFENADRLVLNLEDQSSKTLSILEEHFSGKRS